jgi:hypothetical protein
MMQHTLLMAQEIEISDLVSTSSDEDLYIIGGDDAGVFVGVAEDYYMSGSGNKQVVSYYDLDGVKALESDVMKQERSREFFYTFYFKDQLHTLSHATRESDDGLYHIYLNSYNQQMEAVGDEKDLDQIYPYFFSFDASSMFRSYFSTQFGKMRKGMFISHTTSPAQDKVALFFDFNYFNTSEANFQCVVLGADREVLWSALIDLPEDGSNLLLEDYALDNDGKLYMLMAAFENDSFQKRANDFEYRLFAYDPEAAEANPVAFDTQGKFIINMGLSLGPDQLPKLGGIYADPLSNEIEGGLMVRILEDGSSETTEHAFERSVLREINDDDDDKDAAEEYTINHTIAEEDGSLVFFAESYKRGPMVTAKLRLSAFNPLDTDVEIGDIYKKILAVRITPDQQGNWVEIVDKTQKSSEPKDIYTSYALAYDDEAYYLLYNEDIKSSTDIYLATIKKEGGMSHGVIIDRSDYRMRLIPEFGQMPAPGLLTVPVEKSRKQGVLRIKF